MADYVPPLPDMQFVLRELVELTSLAQLPGCEEATPALVDAILDEAGKFARGVLAPLNCSGDRQGARWDSGAVRTADGWREAYGQFVAAGWNALSCPMEHGGQGLPRLISTLVEEMWNGANVAFALCPMLTRGAIEAIDLHGSATLKQIYLPRLVSGEWTGTMNLTEPQAGSDLAAIRARAEPRADGSYRISGQKTFITYGEHDLADNIVHLVLARTPDAPEGVKGISLFVVPKFLVNADGSIGSRNDVRCISIERKLGIHASPTCVMAFGDGGGAVGYLIGEENQGLAYMFIMMNTARFSIGLEGLGLAEGAYQQALAYARQRVQGTAAGTRSGAKVAILRHPDIRRMLLLMKSQSEAMRALACVVAASMDVAQRHPEPETRRRHQAFVDLMIPVVKGWNTETANEIASLGVQIHGGMGYIEEAGAAQFLRDARITTIYEGTTGIQAIDLVGRKVARDQGRTIRAVLDEIRAIERQLRGHDEPALGAIAHALGAGVSALAQAVDFIVTTFGTDVRAALAGAVPFLKLFGTVAGGWQMARAALAAQRRIDQGDSDTAFLRAKIASAHFYADHLLTQAPGLARIVCAGAPAVLQFTDDQFIGAARQ